MNSDAIPGVVLCRDALQTILQNGVDSLPLETGGILAGFRAGRHVVISHACLVQDSASSTRGYHLDVCAADMALMQLRRTCDDVVGYVGDWHTHPEPTPPSALDDWSLRQAAEASGDLVALLVVSFDGTGALSQIHARLGQRRHATPRRHTGATRSHTATNVASVDVTDLTAAELARGARSISRPQLKGSP